jgi:glutathione synthase/RimK-type ligase-like ATP-grasp enzyme
MGRVGYLLKRITSMDYGKMFGTVNEVHKKCKKGRISIFIDIIKCGMKYQAGYMDYKLFEMYDLNDKQRETVVTRGINNDIVKKYNNPEYTKYFSDKIAFNKKFNKYILRDWMEVDGTEENYNKFKEFCEKHNTILVKPLSECCGKGVEKFEVNKKNMKKIYNNLVETKRYLVEEVAVQCDEIAKLHPSSINTMRIVTLNNQIVAAFLRIGNDNNVVDNFNHGGLVAPINIETGIIDYLAIDKKMNIYERHPLTNESILWFQIPKWPRIKRFVVQASKEIPEVGYVGWDVCLGTKDPFLIEGNEFPGHDLYQLPPHRSDGIGMLPKLKKAMEAKNENSDSNRS